MVKQPQEVLTEYIKRFHQKDLTELNKCDHQTRLQLDYTLFNDYFHDETNLNFFSITNYEKVLADVEKEINKDNTSKNWISIKITDVPPNIVLGNLDSSYGGDVISAKAMIKNITEPHPSLKTAVYECRSCMRLHQINITDNILVEPTVCSECGGRSFRLMYDLSEYKDYRLVKLEEPLELRTGGQSREFKGYMQDYLASPQHTLKAGDVVDIIGKFTVKKTDKANKKNDFEFMIDIHNINPVNNAFEDYRITDEDKQQIIELSQQPHIYERLVESLAPEIVGYETVKEGLLLQMFEGYRPENDVFKNDVLDRWTIHVLLIGDVGIGKSQLITALKKRTPKFIDINGADTSKAGLTTSAVKDELTGAWTLEAGALVLADTGVLLIDEFDKLSKGSQKSLNQAMEQLTVSSAKAGLVQTMSARTSIVACANPKYGRFNPMKSIREQINMPDSTLSRFDLVFALNDKLEVEHDTRLATALLNKEKLMEDIEILDDELFKKYVTYAKLEIFPILTQEAKDELIDFYVETRQSAKEDSAKPITARDLKAVERLTIARAKTELRTEATVEDAQNAIRIYTEALKTIGLSVDNAGELQNMMSDEEMKVITDTENLIVARMKQYDITDVDNLILTDIKKEVGVSCFGLNLNRDEVLNIALGNVRRKIK